VKNKTVPVALTQEQYDHVKQISDRTGIPVHTLVSECLLYGMKHFGDGLPSLPSKLSPQPPPKTNISFRGDQTEEPA
jgi:hypothetical protein